MTESAAVIGVVAAGRTSSLKTNEFRKVDFPHFICPMTPMVRVSFSVFSFISSKEIIPLFVASSFVSGIHPYSTAFVANAMSCCFFACNSSNKLCSISYSSFVIFLYCSKQSLIFCHADFLSRSIE